MSWLSDTVEQVRTVADRAGQGITKILPKSTRAGTRMGLRYASALPAGGMGLQYEYSRNKGMNSQEATLNAFTGGYMYQSARGSQQARLAIDNATEAQAAADADYSSKMASSARFARLQGEVRARRVRRGEGPSNRGGTLLTSSLGIPGSTGGGGGGNTLLGISK